ncbi:MAG: nickel pincer cofactor biosynthesis protein LarC [Mycobacteriales bacterium]
MIGWLDAQAGASGDMLLGALVDAGVPVQVLQAAVDQLGSGLRLTAGATSRAGLGATKVDVLTGEGTPAEQAPQEPTRSWADVRALLARLDADLREQALSVFARLAEAEGAVHRVPADEVHFHEVGALDALADVVGTVAGLQHLGLGALHCSAVALGSGSTRGAHGPVPVPAPAVLVLLRGVPVEAGRSPYESTTPTGAALLATLVTEWGPLPPMTVTAVGLGAGGRDPDEVANVLRLVLGTPLAGTASQEVLLETNVDDLDPRLWPQVLEELLAAGASDAWLTPVLMKKGRPAHTLSVLCRPPLAPPVREVVFRQTSTLGLREQLVAKHALHRTESQVLVDGHQVRVKTAWLDGAPVTANPEWEDVAAAARALGKPARQVLAEAAALARQTSTRNPSAPAPPASGTPTAS